MLLARLVIKNAFRHPTRSLLTVLGVAIAILAFGFLRTVIDAWNMGVEAASPRRLVTRNAISLTFALPQAYKDKIKAVPGVTSVATGNWFGGIYQDAKNFFPNFAVDSREYLAMYPEFVIDDAERDAFLRDRKGAIVGRKTARRFGWKPGDTITLKGTIFPGNWDMTIRGVYRAGRPDTDETLLLFHWDYLNETLKRTLPRRAGQAGYYMLEIADPDNSAAVSAQVDALFKNSLAETLTETEKAFQAGFVSMSAAIITAIRIVSFLVIFVILAVAANTMAMSVRERMSEFAVLKTLGFTPRFVGLLIVAESLVVSLSGTLVALALLPPSAAVFGKVMEQYLPAFLVSRETVVLGALAGLGVGLAAAVGPAVVAARVVIAQGLRKVA